LPATFRKNLLKIFRFLFEIIFIDCSTWGGLIPPGDNQLVTLIDRFKSLGIFDGWDEQNYGRCVSRYHQSDIFEGVMWWNLTYCWTCELVSPKQYIRRCVAMTSHHSSSVE
jgi:hypothetical protein